MNSFAANSPTSRPPDPRGPRRFVLALGSLIAALRLVASGGAPAYEIAPQVLDAGGHRASSANYSHDATLGGALGIAATTPAAPGLPLRNRSGYIAQLFEVQSVNVSGPLTLAENSSATLVASATLDDGTTRALEPANAMVAWGFTGAGQTISSGGEFFPAIVYFDQPARVNASWRGVSGGVDLLVLDVLHDNYGLYANDGLRDLWQVQYFGEANPEAAPTFAPFGDGIVNQLKHAWNVAPADRFNAPTLGISGGFLTLTFLRLKSSVTPRPTYRVQVSADLATWLDDTSPGGPHTTEIGVVSLNAETERVTVRDNTPLAAAGRRFLRLRVSHP